MKYLQQQSRLKLATIGALSLMGLTACSDSDDIQSIMPPEPEPAPIVMQDFDISITNLTANQPLSPVVLLSHASNLSIWQVGEPASVALEHLAEGGDTSMLVALDGIDESNVATTPIGPGANQTLSISIPESQVAQLSIATMLVNTNDAFTGVQQIDLTQLAINVSMTYHTMAYDAGTEANSEAKGTIPGPADMGEGFNAMRETNNRVTGHAGIISKDDGLSDSVLDASHRFDNPVATVSITRKK